MKRRLRNRAAHARRGMTLIEVLVACSLLAITFMGLTAVAIRMGARTRSNAIIEQRTAVFFQEVNRLESLPYDSLTNTRFLQTDSVRSGKGYYVWTYSVGAQQYSNVSGVLPFRDITLTVRPRLAPTATQTGIIRRSRSPYASSISSAP